MTEQATQTNKEQILEVTNLDQFVRILMAWHQQQLAIVKQVMEVPEGVEMEIDGKAYVLTKDNIEFFKAGATVVLSQFNQLPFLAEVEDVPVANG